MRFSSSVFMLLALTPGSSAFVPTTKAKFGMPALQMKGLFNQQQQQAPPAQPQYQAAPVQQHAHKEPPKDFKLAGMVLGSGVALAAAGPLLTAMGSGLAAVGIPIAAVATLFGVRSAQLQLELEADGFGLSGIENNRVIGGKNIWKYKDIVDYEFLPEGWIDQPQGPLLLYFKETGTEVERRKNMNLESLVDTIGHEG